MADTHMPTDTAQQPTPVQPPERNIDDWYIDLITSRFLDNEHLMVVTNHPCDNQYQRLRKLVHYAYHLSKRNDGLITSTDKMTIALYYVKGEQKKSWRDWLNYLSMAWVTIGLKRAWSISQLEKRLGKARNNHPVKKYIHVWFLAQHLEQKGLHGLKEMIDFLRNCSAKRNLPIMIETTNRKAELMYRKVHFEVYDRYEDEQTGIKMSYLMYDPAKHPEQSGD